MKRSASFLAAFRLLLSCLAVATAVVAGSCQPSRACRADGGAGCFGACPNESFYCDERSGQWVACVSDEHCGGATPVCSPSLRECIACATNADCSRSSHGPLCDTSTGQCHECSSNRDCVGNMPVCSLETFTCTACTSDAGCAESAMGPRCDVAAGTCHRCLEDSDCGGATPACLPSTRECVGCVSDAHCASGPAKICDVGTHGCRGCAADAECIEFPGTPYCVEAVGLCRQCTPETEAKDCGTMSCSRITFTCTNRPMRSVGSCGACESDTECTSGICIDRSHDHPTFGRYCLPLIQEPGVGTAPPPPYRSARTGPSTDHGSVRYLSPASNISCEAVLRFNTFCPGHAGAAIPFAACGNRAFGDGFCLAPMGRAPLCTFACNATGISCAPSATCGPSLSGRTLCVPQ